MWVRMNPPATEKKQGNTVRFNGKKARMKGSLWTGRINYHLGEIPKPERSIVNRKKTAVSGISAKGGKGVGGGGGGVGMKGWGMTRVFSCTRKTRG